MSVKEPPEGPIRVRDAAALGELIRELRRSRGFTLVQAAGLAGVGVP